MDFLRHSKGFARADGQWSLTTPWLLVRLPRRCVRPCGLRGKPGPARHRISPKQGVNIRRRGAPACRRYKAWRCGRGRRWWRRSDRSRRSRSRRAGSAAAGRRAARASPRAAPRPARRSRTASSSSKTACSARTCSRRRAAVLRSANTRAEELRTSTRVSSISWIISRIIFSGSSAWSSMELMFELMMSVMRENMPMVLLLSVCSLEPVWLRLVRLCSYRFYIRIHASFFISLILLTILLISAD